MSGLPGRGEYRGWPTRWPVSSLGALVIAWVVGIGIFTYRNVELWTPLQRYYWDQYVMSESFRSGKGNFQVLEGVTRQGQHRLAIDSDVVPVVIQGPRLPQQVPFAVSADGHARGLTGLTISRARYDTAQVHDQLEHWIYGDRSAVEMARPAWLGALGVFVFGLVVAIPRERARRRVYPHTTVLLNSRKISSQVALKIARKRITVSTPLPVLRKMQRASL